MTFLEGPTSLHAGQSFSTTENLPNLPLAGSDTEGYISSPTNEPDFTNLPPDSTVFGDHPDESNFLPLYSLPPLPPDLSPNHEAPHPTDVPLNTSPLATVPPSLAPSSFIHQQPQTSSSLPFSLNDLATLLSKHGLCVMAIPTNPPLIKTKTSTSTINKKPKPKLQRELIGLHSSINYDKTTTLAIREGTLGHQ